MSPVSRALSHETPPCGSRRTALAEIRKSTPCKANCCKTPCDQRFLTKALIARINPDISRRRVMASAVQRPCLRAFLLPLGAPGDGPPCIRHRPFGIAGARHEFPLRVRAPHRGVRCIGNLPRIMLALRLRCSDLQGPRLEDRKKQLDVRLHGRWRSNVWTYPGTSSMVSETRQVIQDHPHVEPVCAIYQIVSV